MVPHNFRILHCDESWLDADLESEKYIVGIVGYPNHEIVKQLSESVQQRITAVVMMMTTIDNTILTIIIIIIIMIAAVVVVVDSIMDTFQWIAHRPVDAFLAEDETSFRIDRFAQGLYLTLYRLYILVPELW